jgi:hypothetical protein
MVRVQTAPPRTALVPGQSALLHVDDGRGRPKSPPATEHFLASQHKVLGTNEHQKVERPLTGIGHVEDAQ